MVLIIPKGQPTELVDLALAGLIDDKPLRFTAQDTQIIDLPGPPRSDRELFIIPQSILDTMNIEDVTATVRALKELDMYRLPYAAVDIQLPADAVLKLESTDGNPSKDRKFGPQAILTLYNITTNPDIPFQSVFTWTTNKRWAGGIQSFCKDIGLVREWMCDTLITLLATRNVVKSRHENKLAKLGIGKAHKHRYTTTLSLPREAENDPAHTPVETGREMAPHLRRGHIRRQHYGPRNSFIKTIWIEPVFVNADKEFVSKRQAYNVSNT